MPGVSIVWLFDPADFAPIFNDNPAYHQFPCRRSHLALEKFRRDRPEIYSSGGLLPTYSYLLTFKSHSLLFKFINFQQRSRMVEIEI